MKIKHTQSNKFKYNNKNLTHLEMVLAIKIMFLNENYPYHFKWVLHSKTAHFAVEDNYRYYNLFYLLDRDLPLWNVSRRTFENDRKQIKVEANIIIEIGGTTKRLTDDSWNVAVSIVCLFFNVKTTFAVLGLNKVWFYSFL